MDDEPRKRPRPPREADDENDVETPYRLKDDEGEAPKVVPRARPGRRRDDEDDEDDLRLRRPRKPRPRLASIPSMDTWVRLGIAGVVVLLVLIGLGCIGIWYVYRSAQTVPFQASMSGYLAAPNRAAPAGGAHAVAGKMVVVDTAKRDLDWDVFFGLPDDRRATKPQEVGTIVQLTWAKNQVQPGYENGAPAFVQTCRVVVIDRKSGTQLYDQTFQGGQPPDSIDSTSSQGVGSKPTDKVLDFLKGLPRQ